MNNGWVYTYTWSNRGEMLEEWTQGYPVRTFAYNAAGQMSEATVFTLTTRFRYNGDGARMLVEVVGQGTTTYTIDYAGGYRVLAETTLTGTVLYLYGRDCLGEQRDDEWLYYLNDATGYVRQGADEQGQVESHWLFDPDGLVIEGPEGLVSHLVCGGVYDWSTGLIFKGNRYFDPSLGIWLSLAPLVVLQGWKGGKKRRWWQRWYVMLVILAGIGGMLVGCGPVTIKEATAEVCTTMPTPTPTPQPLFSIAVVRPPHVTEGVQVEYAVQWKISDPTKKGFIVQHIQKDVSVTDSLGNPIIDPKHDYDDIEFWEAWEVTEGGRIWVGNESVDERMTCSDEEDCDSYQTFNYGKGTKGDGSDMD